MPERRMTTPFNSRWGQMSLYFKLKILVSVFILSQIGNDQTACLETKETYSLINGIEHFGSVLIEQQMKISWHLLLFSQ
jgi:hypothetical protein